MARGLARTPEGTASSTADADAQQVFRDSWLGQANGKVPPQLQLTISTTVRGDAGSRRLLGPDVPVPAVLTHPRFVATPLATDVAALDYAAYMASPDVIRVHSDGRWPTEEFTFAEDLELVALHQADHEGHRAFTFVLLAPSYDEALGCLYLNPLRDYLVRVQAEPQVIEALPRAAAMVTFWLRHDQQDTGLAEVVVRAVNDWLVDDWPLTMHLFRILPGERSSHLALEQLKLPRVDLDLPGEPRSYLWYQGARDRT